MRLGHFMWVRATAAYEQMMSALFRIPEWNYGAWGGTVAGFLAAIFGAGSPRMIGWIGVLMLADLGAGLIRAYVLPDEQIDWARFFGGFLGKLLLLLLIPAAAGVDNALAYAGLNVEMAVKAVLVGLMMHEASSIVQNVKSVKGEVAAATAIIRVLDYWRYHGRPPERRGYDKRAKRYIEEVHEEGVDHPIGVTDPEKIREETER